MKQVKKQKGFTIIELVVVILLLGILTATALPRFMDVTDDAHKAVVSAVVGGLNTGNALYKGEWFAKNQPAKLVSFNSLLANPNGFPLGLTTATLTTTLLSSVGTSQHCVDVFQNLLQAGGQPTIAAKAQTGTSLLNATTLPSGSDFVAYLQTSDLTTKNTCNYIYTGQYSNNQLNDLPVIIYDARTGVVIRGDDI